MFDEDVFVGGVVAPGGHQGDVVSEGDGFEAGFACDDGQFVEVVGHVGGGGCAAAVAEEEDLFALPPGCHEDVDDFPDLVAGDVGDGAFELGEVDVDKVGVGHVGVPRRRGGVEGGRGLLRCARSNTGGLIATLCSRHGY